MRRASAALVLLLLAGCDFFVSGDGEGGGEAPVPAGPTPPPAEAGEGAEKAEDAADSYVYNPIGKRDPFRSFLTFDRRPQVGSERMGPLQKYEIDQYQIVGIIWGIDRPRALLQDPDGVGHVAEIGTYVGKNWGKITQITESEIVVTEEYQTPEGELVVNNINLSLPVSDDGAQ